MPTPSLSYKYLIVGGGMTAAAAVEGIRSADPTGAIGLLSAEPEMPYNRPPLSKALWKGKSVDTIWRELDANDVTLHLDCTVDRLLPAERQVSDANGNVYSYDRLLLATGGSPRRLPYGGEHIIYFRNLADYRTLRVLSETGQRFAVVGGGFIGSEIAAALAMNQKEVAMIFPGQGVGDRVFPRNLAQFVSGVYKEKGVEIVAGEKVTGLETRGNSLVVKTGNLREIAVDGVVAGVGIEPNVTLAQAARLNLDNGIVVDELLRTSQPDIYAAGDVAAFYNPALEKRIRVEHEDNANTMGRMAGRNMAGLSEPYHHLPSFYSDMFDLGYEAIGELDARMDTFADWKQENKEGVIYYLRDGRVRGVLLWNVWGKVGAARELIAATGPFRAKDLKDRIT